MQPVRGREPLRRRPGRRLRRPGLVPLAAVDDVGVQRPPVPAFDDYATELKALDIRRQATAQRAAEIAATEKQLAAEKDDDRRQARRGQGRCSASSRPRSARRCSLAAAAPSRLPVRRRPPPAAPPPPSRYAMAQVGDAYVYGAAGPSAFDCSGLTMMAWAPGRRRLPHSSSAQYGSGPHIAASDLQPGDLVFYYSPISHVGMYIGNGLIVQRRQPRRRRPRRRPATRCRTSARSALADPATPRRDRSPTSVGGRPFAVPCVPGRVGRAGVVTAARRRRTSRRRRRAARRSRRPAPAAARALQRASQRAVADARRRRPRAALAPAATPRAGDLLAAVVAQRAAPCGVADFTLRYVDEAGARRPRDGALGGRRRRHLAASAASTRRRRASRGARCAFAPADGRRRGRRRLRRRATGARPLWLAGPVEVRARRRRWCWSPRAGAGDRPRRRRGTPAGRPRCRSCAGCCRTGARGWSSRCRRRRRRSTRALGRRPGRLRRHRGGHRRRSTARRRRTRRSTSSSTRDVFDGLRPDRRPGRDEPRGHPRRHRRRRAARCRCGCWRASPTTSRCATSTCRVAPPPARSSRQVRRDGRAAPPARTRHEFDTAHAAPRRDLRERLAGLPACSPSSGGEGPWCASTTPSTAAAASTPRCARRFGLTVPRAHRAVAGPAGTGWPA